MMRTIVDNPGTNVVERRQVNEIAAVGVDTDEMEVLITPEVLEVYDAAGAFPEMASDAALGLAADAHGRAALARLHEHVHPPLIGLHERDALAVRRELEGGLLGVPEEVAQRDEVRAGQCCACHQPER